MGCITPNYVSVHSIRDVCEPWIEAWADSSWGELMHALRRACHVDHGFSYEDCALFASKLLENLIAQYELTEYYEDVNAPEYNEVRRLARIKRDYWLSGGNLKDEASRRIAAKTLADLPDWLFGRQ